jgi:DNA modification methylase
MTHSLVKIKELVEVPEFKNFYANQSNEELKTSILEEGLKTPIIVSKDYTFIDGYRRVQVYQDLGYEYISCVFVEEQPTLQERITRNMTRQKSSQDIVNEYRQVFLRYPKKQGKRNHDGTPYVRDQKISDALGGKFKGDVIVNKLEKILFNDLEGDILSKGIVDKNWKVDTCHDFLFKWKEIDEMKKYGFTKQLTDGQLSVSEVNKFIEEKESLDNRFENSFIIPDKISVWNEDCRMIDKLLNNEKVIDLLFGSVAYWNLREYVEEGENQRGHEKTKEEYAENVANDVQKIENVLKESGSVIINIGETYIDGLAQGIPFIVRDAILKHTNLFHVDTYIWSKKNSRPQGEGVKRLQNSIEYLFHFVKDPKKYKFNVLKYPVEGKVSKLVSGAKDVSKDGKVSKKSKSISKNYGKLVSHLKEQEIENIVTTSIGKDHELYKIISSGHPAPMSPMLPVTFILMLTGELDTVADIWGGSQVTGKISTLLNRRYVSTEISKEYFNIGCQRLLNAVSDFDRDSLDFIQDIAYEELNNSNTYKNDTNQDLLVNNRNNTTNIELSKSSLEDLIASLEKENNNSIQEIPKTEFSDGSILYNGDNLSVLKKLPDNSIYSIVTDPPYDLTDNRKGSKSSKGFMGKEWDGTGIAFNVDLWKECLRVLKPGGYILAFGGTRTIHKMTSAIEESGFKIKDQIMWVYGQGFPKSRNIGKDLERVELEKYGTGLKPAFEPIIVAQKPISEKTIAKNFVNWGTGVMNIDDCRIPFEDTPNPSTNPLFRHENNYKMPRKSQKSKGEINFTSSKNDVNKLGRFPSNVIFDEFCSKILDEQKGISRFFYCPKANKIDKHEGLEHLEPKTIRNCDKKYSDFNSRCSNCGKKIYGSKNYICACDNRIIDNSVFKLPNNHPTVKPTELMEYLVKLVTPDIEGAICLDIFGGSGSTGKAIARLSNNIKFILIEKEKEYYNIAIERIKHEFSMQLDESKKVA